LQQLLEHGLGITKRLQLKQKAVQNLNPLYVNLVLLKKTKLHITS